MQISLTFDASRLLINVELSIGGGGVQGGEEPCPTAIEPGWVWVDTFTAHLQQSNLVYTSNLKTNNMHSKALLNIKKY